ncbi:MAG: PhzF family phenazine biosynthesis protein [Alphaproteobacteria bacterium]|nr:PhzF family phenazine biosynthesis protein [Alphaproteobacteria bacterium]
MQLALYQVDAFASKVFAGNPAAVVPLQGWLDDATMQAIATENNLSETAFTVRKSDGDFDLRWFTPAAEVDLCGHATLGAAFVLFRTGAAKGATVAFDTRSGRLGVRKDGDLLVMDFPLVEQRPVEPEDALIQGLGRRPLELFAGTDLLAVYGSEAEVRALNPDMAVLGRLKTRGVIATAPGERADFCSRFFAPGVGVPEDPVTGSTHCQLTPYWAKRLGKATLSAHQVSARGGELRCTLKGARVEIAGTAVPYLDATITI